MFLCRECIEQDKVKITGKAYALMMLDAGRGSYGPCESCKKVGVCADA